MSWDRPIHSFNSSNGDPQTPKRTPTSVAFGESTFQTPKLESSFYDPRVTWNTADPYASSPEFLKTPQRFGLTTPSNHNYLHGLAERDSNLEPSASFALSLSPQLERTTLAGTVGVKKTKGGAKKSSNSRSGKKTSDDQGDEGGKDTSDSAKHSAASMQTPPPTSTGRRKMQNKSNPVHTHLATGSTTGGADGMMGPPDSGHLQTPSRVGGISANLFDGQTLNLFQAAAGSSADSPFLPQNRLFWDQDTQFSTDSLDMPDNYGDPFGPNQTTTAAFDHGFVQSGLQNDTLQVPKFDTLQATSGMGHFDDSHAFNTPSMGSIDSNLYHSSFSTSPRLPTVRDEDPAMFLSSPARRFGFSESNMPQNTPPRLETRQPYHHQTEESKREKKLKELKRAKSLARRKAEAADEALDALRQSRSLQLLSRRNSTHSTHPHNRHASVYSSGAGSYGNGVRKTPTKGRLSPLKTEAPSFHRPSSSAALCAPVESVVLKIGKDGRAKTEMKVVTEPPATLARGPGMDLEESSAESETESSDESDFPISHSTNTSFHIPPESTPRQRNMSCAHSTSRPQSKSSSSYSSTVASPHSGRHSPWTNSSRSSGRLPQLPAQKDSRMLTRRQHTNPPGGHSRGQSITDSEATQEDDDEAGDAQHALKQVLRTRSRQAKLPTALYNRKTRHLHNPGTLRSSPPGLGSQFDSHHGDISSPTTITDPDFATPTTDRQSNPSNGTRCVCNSMDNGGHLMIQCESCTHWLHTKCVGLDRQSLPPVYICIYCTQTPMRGGRIRDPLAGTLGGQIPTSPLAHKSYRFR
ncbi:PHD finger domain-containing protein [Histoplasma ohiense]